MSVRMDGKILENIKCYWSVKKNVWRPPVRIGATLTLCGNRIYMFGGYNKLAMNDLYYLDPKNAKWITLRTTKGKRP